MQLKNTADSSSDSLLNEPTDSSLVEPILDSPPAQENSDEVLLEQEDVVPLMPELAPNAPQKKRRIFSSWGVLAIFTVLGIGSVLLVLPSFLSVASCGQKGKQAEAKQNIGSTNRAQQAYFLDNQTFANSMEAMGIGIKPQTVNYNYSVRTTKTTAFHYGIARRKTEKSYVGAVFVVPATNVNPATNKSEVNTASIICEALRPGSTTPTAPTLQKGVPTCGSDTKDLTSRYK